MGDEGGTAKRAAPRRPAAKKAPAKRAAAGPRIHASHTEGTGKGLPRAPRPATRKVGSKTVPAPQRALASELARPAATRKTRRSVPPAAVPEPSAAARDLALAIASAGIEKKALGIEILDVTGKVDYADFLVLMTGRSDRHVASIAQGIEEALGKKKIRPMSTEGMSTATWILMDYGDVVVHVFQEDTRRLYDIEGLWIDADRLSTRDSGGAQPAS